MQNYPIWRTGEDGDSGGDVYVYNTATQNKIQVTKNGYAMEPAIYENRVVYTYGSNIYMYDISTAKTTSVTTSNSALGPSIYNDKIVYADSRNYPETGEIRDIYLYNLNPETEKLKAIFFADVTSGSAPLNVSFSDISSGMPNAWYWNFGDGTNSTQQNPTHNYLSAGNYTALLKVSDANGTDSMSVVINVLKPVPLIANFSTNVSKGYAPLTVQFTDLSENAKTWDWDFGDGTFDHISSFQQNPMHTYYSAGNYTVNLTITDLEIANRKSATITVLEQPVQILPKADFNYNITSSYVPLTVQFTDASQNATAWNWDFGDGTNSTQQNPTHIYYAEGTYNTNLTVSNANGTDSKAATITVQSESSSSGYSSSDSSSGSGGSSSGSGSAGGSSEAQSNVDAKELSQTFIASGNYVKFDFPQKATPVMNISFDSKKTTGKTTTIVEILKGKSTLVSGLPSDEVYKYLNIWVGNNGYATPNNIENAVVCFKVEKSWIQDKKIDKSSITLNRYSDMTWSKLPTSLSSEDDKYLYFTAQTPGFSPFAITGKIKATVQPADGKTQTANVNVTQTETNTENTTVSTEQKPEQTQSSNTSGKGSTKTPGFEAFFGIVSLFTIFLHKRK